MIFPLRSFIICVQNSPLLRPIVAKIVKYFNILCLSAPRALLSPVAINNEQRTTTPVPIEILSATFYNADITARIQALLDVAEYVNDTHYAFTADYKLLGVDTLPFHIKPFALTYRSTDGSQAPILKDILSTPVTVRATPVNIIYSDAKQPPDIRFQAPVFQRPIMVSASWWTKEAMYQCMTLDGPWVVNQTTFSNTVPQDPAPGIDKTLSTTWAFPTGAVAPNPAKSVPVVYTEGAIVEFIPSAQAAASKLDMLELQRKIEKAAETTHITAVVVSTLSKFVWDRIEQLWLTAYKAAKFLESMTIVGNIR